MPSSDGEATPILHALPVPRDHRDWWSTSLDIPSDSIDAFGHMTAARYPGFVDEAIGAFFEHLFGLPIPDYVAAQFCLRFRRELTLDRGPARAYVGLDAFTRSAIELTVVLDDTEGVACTVVKYRGVAWDRERHGSRPLTVAERTALEAHS